MIGVYQVISIVLSILVLLGIKLMSSPKTARKGNALSALAMLLAVISIMLYNKILTVPLLWVGIVVGSAIGCTLAYRVKMIEMPQMVALLNGLGGGASALVAIVEISNNLSHMAVFSKVSGLLALVVGGVTLSGSLIAAGKLDRRIPQKPVALPGDKAITTIIFVVTVGLTILGAIYTDSILLVICIVLAFISLVYGVLFAMRVGGGDMPITISLLNSFSGLAASISGLTIGDPLLVSVGAIVGASGLILTQIMCKAMNRSLFDVLNGAARSSKTISNTKTPNADKAKVVEEKANKEAIKAPKVKTVEDIVEEAKSVIIVPGYGMAVAQAQNQVKTLFDLLESKGKEVNFAIHPVAGRMPGHMNVLLAEVDIPYDKLKEMDEINEKFKETDLVIVIGASDVINPAANTAEGTPIYGMPVLKAEEAKNVIVFNLDDKPGYSGVENTLYTMEHVRMIMGNASETVNELNMKVSNYSKEEKAVEDRAEDKSVEDIVEEAKNVIIVPGYGMAVAQAQNQVKTLFDLLESKGKEVNFAIHPVAGRMPGHMNVLLAEVDIPYDKLKEMDEINEKFKETDLVIVIGASDVINPAANTAEGTPIYGMPVLKAEEAKNVIVFNLDDKPGYSGVENTLYTMEHVRMIMGNASETVNELNMKVSNYSKEEKAVEDRAEDKSVEDIVEEAKNVIIVPGYGMAVAQAQNQVKTLFDLLESKGKEVNFAIHPVAGRMPGHMNVLLAEVDIPYDKLKEMDEINEKFKETDLVIVIGASDVINPAANTAEGTPIYGMPVLKAEEAKNVIVFNLDDKPGYSGVENTLYTMRHVRMIMGNASETLNQLNTSISK